ncbi:adenosylcobinamide-GDP ribazoletransferase [Anaerobranca gottschalkii]|uniref:Adenosylcobinamide-GDP ribazoletransferase n=1 Tax=Anaerobranca gottschalkii DSM 13577 TaxID=1120990 RepID=A0A1I0A1C8_9FIRM|nr:adenosylcobinamide-GDP ribazoletransferase [Anaerobranca gottschalkii]SES87891.1 cobalamin-5'-phosphate synthase [Anaerobranca gottschalkii DSM 13577]
MKRFLLMVQFFTRIPINKEFEIEEGDFHKGVIYLPLIGLIIGLFMAGIYYITKTYSGDIIAIVMALLFGYLITGALHIDGLADTCDAIFTMKTKEKMLEIMKDSRLGTYGTLAVLFDILLKVSLLLSLDKSYRAIAIIVAPVIGRTFLTVSLYKAEYPRKDGTGNLFVGKVTLLDIVLTMVISLFLIFFILRVEGLLVFAIAIPFTLLVRKYLIGKVGGLTGDMLGTINEVNEILTLFILMFLQNWR